ncbi:heat shock 70 kDa protein 12A-like [Mercenaria mercenaria]|uniref:heat shock 70 kDa protein 12A-like n=1 Tax=Mercenaria mercenaria TaxID=6596 RepID=UPI00234E5374|nr:heat shock 70 kDa protein 12A-like [Mercenaria mercenaria]XP_045193639.2 heat shock 70 kDa protein 12A-like [Mercenaria mercenaria]XP_045193640.2 heat shock 70 kDa protein 12A-like [Mercenaria mercenaria]XP_053401225.1 heat shock 70 kDa protein 12A-like [Mercenaria mercenaria]XP_053401227.1 heat shock 70 kDa protein 12A-like [Mercenaria mercenaria]XP_053401228.1 heat shock 70 kDa protein 12A-like [Mercenaria mercenaria]
MADTDYFVIAAIDFGTTYSGYAFQLTSEYDPTDPTKKIFSPQAWNDGSTKLTSLKTPTCLLLDNNEDIDSFGFMAEEKYADLCMDGDNKNWYFFRRFKMQLHDTTGLKRTTMLSDETGRKLSALKVFSKSIECLKNNFSELLQKKNCHVLPHEIKWVLTVPAIWDDTAKGFMRQAAKEAGIPSEHLTIALEPEAASLFCQHLPVEKLNVGGQVKFSDAKPGTTYMIVDLGGGTADITVHEKVSCGKLKEVDRASGGPWGGTSVDGAFIQLISSIVGGPVFAVFMKKHTVDYLDLMREFESVKRNVSLSTTDDIKMKLPVTLNDTCKEQVKKDFKELVKVAKRDKDITFVGDKAKFKPALMQALFKKATDKIVDHMKYILDKTPVGKKVSLILMVGGFSESAFIQDVIKAEFHNKKDRKVLIPKEAGISVVQGAVVFGRHPENITSRVQRFSYGAKLSPSFDAKIHKSSKMYKTEKGDARCNDIFGEFMHCGTEVKVGHTVSTSYTTVRPFQGDTDLQVFTSTREKTMYTDEDGCKKLGQLTIKIPNPSEEIREISVQYVFGDTELHIHASDVKSKVPCKTTLSIF